jgi:hypothetical protein
MRFHCRRDLSNTIVLLILSLFLLASCASEISSTPAPNTVGAAIKGKRILVGYESKESMPVSYAPEFVCDLLRERLGVQCVNLFGEGGKILEEHGITADQFIRAEGDFVISGKMNETYQEGIRLLKVDFSLSLPSMHSQLIGRLDWEVSLAATLRDSADPRRKVGEAVEGGSEWGWNLENTELKAVRKTAKKLTKSLVELPYPPE